MKLHPIEIAAKKLPPSIWNTAREYKEGRNILIYCLAKASKRTIMEVVDWLKESEYEIKDLDKYIIPDDKD